jgi:hypothetical protein
VAFTAVSAQTFYTGQEYPGKPLTDASHGGFELRVKLQLTAAEELPQGGTLRLSASFGAVESRLTGIPVGTSDASIVLPAKAVKLWWPRGLGAQALYNVTISFRPNISFHPKSSGNSAAFASAADVICTRQVGFRSIALVTSNDTDATIRNESRTHNGSGGFTMFLRINGAGVAVRGGNKVPMENLEGRLSGPAHRKLVQSAAEAGFTMLRVWGGGIYEPDAFYDACDEFGILIYHDLQFAVGNIDLHGAPSPLPSVTTHPRQLTYYVLSEIVHELFNYSAAFQNFSAIVERETTYQVQRLSHHPALAIWDGE